jgi:undecaprenyl-diphosphatase
MTVLQSLILGLLQGATEFIPVSSSGHLTLVPWLFGWTFDPVLKGAFDVLAHWGTLIALVAVFWRELWGLVQGGWRTLGLFDLGDGGGLRGWLAGFPARIRDDPQGRLAWLIALASIPAIVLGVALEEFFEMLFGAPRVVSVLLFVTAGMLAYAEWKGEQGRDLLSLGAFDALLVGLGQATAIAPGISRSGATMSSGMMRGIDRASAARFSFWLSAPVIIGAGIWQLKDLFATDEWTAHLLPLIIGFLAAAIAGYLCIRFLLNYVRSRKLYPFAIYCVAFGTLCLIVSFVRG